MAREQLQSPLSSALKSYTFLVWNHHMCTTCRDTFVAEEVTILFQSSCLVCCEMWPPLPKTSNPSLICCLELKVSCIVCPVLMMRKRFTHQALQHLKTLDRMHWLPISQSSPSVDTCTHNWLSWFFFFFFFNNLWFLYDSGLKRCCNLQLISTASARSLHLLLASPLICSSSSKRFFSFFSSFISSTQMAPFIFLLRTPMLLCLRLLSGLLVLVKAKLKMIAVRLFFFFLLPSTLTREHINLHWGIVT